jgi:antitoxin ParD1/3/4/toxin ParE1/3/4
MTAGVRYLVAPSAQVDVREIVDYVADRSPQNAIKVVQRLYDEFDRIADLPGIGHTREELKDDTLRVTTVYNYLIIYDPTRKPLEILRVVHGARELWPIRRR